MPDEDRNRADVVGDAFERGVSLVARACLDVGSCVDLHRDDPGLGTERGCGVTDDAGVTVGAGAQAVVDVHRDDGK